MGAGVVKPEQNGFRIHIHSPRMGTQNSTELKCEECATKFSPFKKQVSDLAGSNGCRI